MSRRTRPTGPVYQAERGTLDYFLVERYCLFMKSRTGELGYLDVHHLPWPLQPATARIDVNTMAAAAGIELPADPPLVHFARHLEVLAWNCGDVVVATTQAAFDVNIYSASAHHGDTHEA